MLPNRYILLIAVFICVGAIFLTTSFNVAMTPFTYVAEVVFVPIQNGINFVSRSILSFSEEFQSKQDLLEENAELQAKVDELPTENNRMELDTHRLVDLQEHYYHG
ncbi:MAG: hypothetical protein K5840_00590, partial [Eubacterium sp.]|nr:hypothetical protein [Eubacterium sp.]